MAWLLRYRCRRSFHPRRCFHPHRYFHPRRCFHPRRYFHPRRFCLPCLSFRLRPYSLLDRPFRSDRQPHRSHHPARMSHPSPVSRSSPLKLRPIRSALQPKSCHQIQPSPRRPKHHPMRPSLRHLPFPSSPYCYHRNWMLRSPWCRPTRRFHPSLPFHCSCSCSLRWHSHRLMRWFFHLSRPGLCWLRNCSQEATAPPNMQALLLDCCTAIFS
jgi:hypothetical protein